MLKDVAQQFDSVALEYDFMAKLFHSSDFVLANLSKNRVRALDIGCGSGHLVAALSPHYQHVVGIDVSDSLLAIALAKRSLPNIDYICMDAEHMAFSEKFDLIVSQNTLHHIDNVPKLLERLKQLLKANGKLIISDVISENPTPPTWIYIVGAMQELIPNIHRYGIQIAWRVFRFRLSSHWLTHLANDVYLSAQDFRELYATSLPDCEFVDDRTLIWQKSDN